MAASQYVVPREERWAVRGRGEDARAVVFATQADAIRHARMLARLSGGELVIHGRDGRIREKRGYAPARAPHAR